MPPFALRAKLLPSLFRSRVLPILLVPSTSPPTFPMSFFSLYHSMADLETYRFSRFFFLFPFSHIFLGVRAVVCTSLQTFMISCCVKRRFHPPFMLCLPLFLVSTFRLRDEILDIVMCLIYRLKDCNRAKSCLIIHECTMLLYCSLTCNTETCRRCFYYLITNLLISNCTKSTFCLPLLLLTKIM